MEAILSTYEENAVFTHTKKIKQTTHFCWIPFVKYILKSTYRVAPQRANLKNEKKDGKQEKQSKKLTPNEHDAVEKWVKTDEFLRSRGRVNPLTPVFPKSVPPTCISGDAPTPTCS